MEEASCLMENNVLHLTWMVMSKMLTTPKADLSNTSMAAFSLCIHSNQRGIYNFGYVRLQMYN